MKLSRLDDTGQVAFDQGHGDAFHRVSVSVLKAMPTCA